MQRLTAFSCLLALVALLPAFVEPTAPRTPEAIDFPGWPARFRQPGMQRRSLEPAEQRFARDFPGKVAKFSDGERQYIVRFVARPTRRLHPAQDCFRASGYHTRPLAVCPRGADSGCLVAERGNQRLLVREEISDAKGRRFGDVSAWYWATLQGATEGPWWSVTSIEHAVGSLH